MHTPISSTAKVKSEARNCKTINKREGDAERVRKHSGHPTYVSAISFRESPNSSSAESNYVSEHLITKNIDNPGVDNTAATSTTHSAADNTPATSTTHSAADVTAATSTNRSAADNTTATLSTPSAALTAATSTSHSAADNTSVTSTSHFVASNPSVTSTTSYATGNTLGPATTLPAPGKAAVISTTDTAVVTKANGQLNQGTSGQLCFANSTMATGQDPAKSHTKSNIDSGIKHSDKTSARVSPYMYNQPTSRDNTSGSSSSTSRRLESANDTSSSDALQADFTSHANFYGQENRITVHLDIKPCITLSDSNHSRTLDHSPLKYTPVSSDSKAVVTPPMTKTEMLLRRRSELLKKRRGSQENRRRPSKTTDV